MTNPSPRSSRPWIGRIISVVVLALAVATAATAGWWWPQLQTMLTQAPAEAPKDDHKDDHDHKHDDNPFKKRKDNHDHGDSPDIELTASAIQTIGLKSQELARRDFERTITVPAMVVERPGRSVLQISAHFSGKVTRVYPVVGETVKPGQPLFHLHLTHEELVHNQTDLLEAIEKLNVVERELTRLESIAAEGIVAGKTVLENKYDQQKLNAEIRMLRQALAMHGLTDPQIDGVVKDRKLLQGIDILVPTGEEQPGTAKTLWQVQSLNVDQGQHIEIGATMCTLVDYDELYLEGTAFEHDASALNTATAASARLTALLEVPGKDTEFIPDLELVYVANKIDPADRTLKFYARLPNHIVRDSTTSESHRFITWQFKPGQRMHLQIPVEKWTNRLVLPASAVVQDGAESYAFERHGDHFHRVPVACDYRDRFWVVLSDKNQLEVGDSVVTSGAEQLQLTLKQKSAGPAGGDHHGHNH